MTDTIFAQQLQSFLDAYQSLFAIAETFPPALQTQGGVCGDWSAREVLAHINGWIVEAQRRYPRFSRGTGNIDYNHDAFNDVSIWLRDGRDFAQILDETRQLVEKMRIMAEDLPAAYIERDERYGSWLNTLIEEAESHGQQLRKFLEVNT